MIYDEFSTPLTCDGEDETVEIPETDGDEEKEGGEEVEKEEEF